MLGLWLEDGRLGFGMPDLPEGGQALQREMKVVFPDGAVDFVQQVRQEPVVVGGGAPRIEVEMIVP